MKKIDLLNILKMTVRELLAEELRDVATRIERGQLISAAWRLADSGRVLRQMLERRELKNVEGLDIKTGRGALLP